VENLKKEELGICNTLVEAVEIAAELRNYEDANFINIYALYEEGIEELLSKDLYSSQDYDGTSNRFTYHWLDKATIQSRQETIFKEWRPRERVCFKCKRRLDYPDFCQTNRWLAEKQAQQLWEHPNVELFCCSCFRRLKSSSYASQTTERRAQRPRRRELLSLVNRFHHLEEEELIPEEAEKLSKLEEELDCHIPVVEKVDDEYHTINYGYIPRNGRIIGLALFYSGLHAFPKALTHFSHLEYLDLSGNFIEKIPDWIHKIQSLKYLKMLSNRISEMPQSIAQLESLEYLDLSGNRFQALPSVLLKLSSLQYLYLWANCITHPRDVLAGYSPQGVNVLM